MPFFNTISFGPSSVLTMLVVVLLAVVALYLMRTPAHGAIISLTRVLHAALRMASISVFKGQKILAERNREVLLAAGREAAEHIIEREFDRMDAAVRRDLAECPALQRKMNEQVSRIEEDHGRSTESAPCCRDRPHWARMHRRARSRESRRGSLHVVHTSQPVDLPDDRSLPMVSFSKLKTALTDGARFDGVAKTKVSRMGSARNPPLVF